MTVSWKVNLLGAVLVGVSLSSFHCVDGERHQVPSSRRAAEVVDEDLRWSWPRPHGSNGNTGLAPLGSKVAPKDCRGVEIERYLPDGWLKRVDRKQHTGIVLSTSKVVVGPWHSLDEWGLELQKVGFGGDVGGVMHMEALVTGERSTDPAPAQMDTEVLGTTTVAVVVARGRDDVVKLKVISVCTGGNTTLSATPLAVPGGEVSIACGLILDTQRKVAIAQVNVREDGRALSDVPTLVAYRYSTGRNASAEYLWHSTAVGFDRAASCHSLTREAPLALSQDGEVLVSVGKTVTALDMGTGQILASFPVTQSEVWSQAAPTVVADRILWADDASVLSVPLAEVKNANKTATTTTVARAEGSIRTPIAVGADGALFLATKTCVYRFPFEPEDPRDHDFRECFDTLQDADYMIGFSGIAVDRTPLLFVGASGDYPMIIIDGVTGAVVHAIAGMPPSGNFISSPPAIATDGSVIFSGTDVQYGFVYRARVGAVSPAKVRITDLTVPLEETSEFAVEITVVPDDGLLPLVMRDTLDLEVSYLQDGRRTIVDASVSPNERVRWYASDRPRHRYYRVPLDLPLRERRTYSFRIRQRDLRWSCPEASIGVWSSPVSVDIGWPGTTTPSAPEPPAPVWWIVLATLTLAAVLAASIVAIVRADRAAAVLTPLRVAVLSARALSAVGAFYGALLLWVRGNSLLDDRHVADVVPAAIAVGTAAAAIPGSKVLSAIRGAADEGAASGRSAERPMLWWARIIIMLPAALLLDVVIEVEDLQLPTHPQVNVLRAFRVGAYMSSLCGLFALAASVPWWRVFRSQRRVDSLPFGLIAGHAVPIVLTVVGSVIGWSFKSVENAKSSNVVAVETLALVPAAAMIAGSPFFASRVARYASMLLNAYIIADAVTQASVGSSTWPSERAATGRAALIVIAVGAVLQVSLSVITRFVYDPVSAPGPSDQDCAPAMGDGGAPATREPLLLRAARVFFALGVLVGAVMTAAAVESGSSYNGAYTVLPWQPLRAMATTNAMLAATAAVLLLAVPFLVPASHAAELLWFGRALLIFALSTVFDLVLSVNLVAWDGPVATWRAATYILCVSGAVVICLSFAPAGIVEGFRRARNTTILVHGLGITVTAVGVFLVVLWKFLAVSPFPAQSLSGLAPFLVCVHITWIVHPRDATRVAALIFSALVLCLCTLELANTTLFDAIKDPDLCRAAIAITGVGATLEAFSLIAAESNPEEDETGDFGAAIFEASSSDASAGISLLSP